MNELEITYEGKTKTYFIPSKIDEMDSKSFQLYIFQLRFQTEEKAFRGVMFTTFLRQAKCQRLALLYNQSNYEALAEKFTDFLFTEEKPILLNCLIDTLFSGPNKLVGFGTLCSKLTFRQFRKVQSLWLDYQETESETILNEAIAWLYTPKLFRSIPFITNRYLTEKSAKKRAKKIAKLDFNTRFAIMSNFNSVKDSIKYKYPLTLLKSSEKQKFFDESQEIDIDTIYEDMIYTRSGGDITKDNLVDLSPLLDIFSHFESEHRDFKRQQEALKNT